MISYFIPSYFMGYDRDESGVSGGMRVKTSSVVQAVQKVYHITMSDKLEDLTDKIMLVEPLSIQMHHDPESALAQLEDHPAKKILACSELAMLRIKGSYRDRLLKMSNVVTASCEYLMKILTALGANNVLVFNDAVDCELFKPKRKHKYIVCTGLISTYKNSEFIVDLFKRLWDEKKNYKTVYIGGANLWGNATKKDFELEAEIKSYSDIFLENVSVNVVAKWLSKAAIYVNDTIHDVFSQSHAEALMSGCLMVCGCHPIYQERPGIHGLVGVDEFMDVLNKETDKFDRLPDVPSSHRDWAVANLSGDAFLSRLQEVLRVL